MPLLSKADYLYQCRTFDGSGNLVGLYDNLVSLYYRKLRRGVGLAVLTVPDGHSILSQLADDLLLDVYFIYRPLAGGEVTDQQDFTGLYRDKQTVTDSDGNVHHLLYFPAATEVLQRDIIAYNPGIANKTQWTSTQAKDIAGTIVDTNCGLNATAVNGRLRDASRIRNLTTAASGTSATINYAASYRNVLEVVQELADAGGFDFQVRRVSTTSTDLQFFARAPYLGTDKSATIIFDLNLDNIMHASLEGGRNQEKTVAIVGGAGIGASRTFSIRTGPNRSASNDYEVFVDARSNASTELASIGDAKLNQLEAKRNIEVEIAPSSGYVYRRDYGLGDLITVSFAGGMAAGEISAVEVKFDQDQNTTIKIELVNL